MAVFLHGLEAQAKLKGDRVTVEAFFSDDTPAANAQVKVAAASGDRIAEGRTNEKGEWSFPRPAPGKYSVVVDGGDGHRKKVMVTIPSDATLSAHSVNPDETEVVVTSGPSRSELTRFPWLRAGLGVGAIGCLGAVLWLATRRRIESAN
jgi:hypothetical protein